MVAAIEITNGRATFGYAVGQPAWHNLGKPIDPDLPVEDWAQKVGLTWEVEKCPIFYSSSAEQDGDLNFQNRFVLARSDTGYPFTIVSDRYKVHQPYQVLEFFKEITGKYGDFRMNVIGALDKGKAIWGLAVAKEGVTLGEGEHLLRYLLATTSYEEKRKTRIKQIVTRVVCQNTMAVAMGERSPEIIVSHRNDFNEFEIHQEMALDEDWAGFVTLLDSMAKRKLNATETLSFMESVFYPDLKEREGKALTVAENQLQSIAAILKSGPGAKTEAADGTLYGAIQGITRFIDFEARARNDSNRLKNAWWGQGERVKSRAMELAKELI